MGNSRPCPLFTTKSKDQGFVLAVVKRITGFFWPYINLVSEDKAILGGFAKRAL